MQKSLRSSSLTPLSGIIKWRPRGFNSLGAHQHDKAIRMSKWWLFSGAADRGLAQKLIDGRSVSFLWEHLDEVREERSECLHGFVALWHSDGEPGWTVGEPVVFIPSIGLDVHAYPSFMGGGEYAHLADGGVMSNVVASVVSEGLTDDSV